MSERWVLSGSRVVCGGSVRPAAVVVEGERIASVVPRESAPADLPVRDVGDAAVLPGLVDSHVHINDPGRSSWEGFGHATRAAAAGGITTLVDMPLNSLPPTVDVAGLEAKRAAAESRLWVDVGFWAGVVPGNEADLRPLWERGVLGFKAFLAPSGVEEFQPVGDDELRRSMPLLAEMRAPLLAHAESAEVLTRCAPALVSTAAERRSYARYLASRPPEAELVAISLLIDRVTETGCRLHVVHLADAAESLSALDRARRAGLPISVETCPHYLTFAADEIEDGATTFKCAPPIRRAAHREGLWSALRDGLIDLIASDHSPSPPAGKDLAGGDFDAAWGGIASLQVSLPAVWTEASRRGFGLGDVARWMSGAPAELAGLEGRKGFIARGYDADLVVFEPETEWRLEPEQIRHRHRITPYLGRELRGRVMQTYLRGRRVFELGREAGDPAGQMLDRTAWETRRR